MQKAIIVRYRYRNEHVQSALKELNEHLADGWRIVSMCPMGGASLSPRAVKDILAVFASIVVLEK